MADKDIELKVRVNADTGKLEIISQEIKQTAGESEKLDKGFFNLNETAKNLGLTLAGVFSARQAIQFLSDSVREAEQENEALRRLNFNLEANGISWKNNENAVKSWASTIQATTRFNDSQAFDSLERMVRVTGNLTKAQEAVQLAMNMSSASGQSLERMLDILANLYTNNTRALIPLRQEFKAFIGNSEDALIILENLRNRFSGAAQAEDSFTKSSAQTKAIINDLKESIGNDLIPVLERTNTTINNILIGFKEVQKELNPTLKAIQKGMEEHKNVLEQIFAPIAYVLNPLIEAHKKVFDALDSVGTKSKEIADSHAQDKQKMAQDTAVFNELAFQNFANRVALERELAMKEQSMELELSNLRQQEFEKNRKKAEDVATSISTNFARAFTDVTVRGRDMGQVLDNIFQQLIERLVFATAKLLAFKAAGLATGPAGGFLLGAVFCSPGFQPQKSGVITQSDLDAETASAIRFAVKSKDLAEKNSGLSV